MHSTLQAPFPTDLLIDTPDGPVPLTPERAGIPLPSGLDEGGPQLTYGPYLGAIARFLLADSGAPLLEALSTHLRRPVPAESIRRLSVISEKHGAFYHVSRLRVQLADTVCTLAIDTAVRPEQHAVLENEFSILEELHARFGLPYLPRPCLVGETACEIGQAAAQRLKLFIVEWFEGYHEFHLSRTEASGEPMLKVWDENAGGTLLDPIQAGILYGRAAHILTSYLDDRSFREIYPWHHAAGDFVVHLENGLPELRLITARGYRCLAPQEPGSENAWISIVHFFLNMTMRLRLDRLDGTGELAWAGAGSVPAVLRGFLQAWREKSERTPGLPSVEDVIGVLRSFSRSDWLSLAGPVLENGLMEAEEYPFLSERIPEHVSRLVEAIRSNVV